MPTPALLAFTYSMLATPFLVWAFFRYTDLKGHKDYYAALDVEIDDTKNDLIRLKAEQEAMASELNSMRLRGGLRGKEKSRF